MPTKKRLATWFHRYLANPVTRRMPGQTVLETIGRTSGLPRQTPIGGRVIDGAFWLVSDHGEKSNYVRNIKANPLVRIRIANEWRPATARLVPDDDPRLRLKKLPKFNGMLVRALGTDLLSVRLDLDPV
ncbi:deazaflavin-dependent oxidoreductase, nitroreductase family [Frankineae bacterium MT45]|nr:deazaflavin-dependent oxidoreductase, nitroreductase family [Frankineae bacterium MT45]